MRVFANAAQHQAGACAVKKPGNQQGRSHGQVDHGVLGKKRGADKGQITQARHGMCHLGFELFAHIGHAHKGRKSAAKQADGQAGGVLVGVEPNHQNPKQRRRRRARQGARPKGQPGVAGMKSHRKTHHRSNQHHAFGAQVDDADFFIDQQAQTGQRQRGTRRQSGGNEQGKFVHARALRPMR